ncbi:MAG: RNA methyltransferase [Verrucomicrobia bacterium]|nr:MAG: RNA methyltransferase [Verrucomicrobiota bacterium]
MNFQGQCAADEKLEFHASAIAGTEEVLCDELRELGLPSVRFNRGGIPFRGTWRDGWRACLQSRIAQRIHVLLARFPAPSPAVLYTGVQSVAWARHLTSKQTFSVHAVCRGSQLTHEGVTALKVKDAIVDQLRASQGLRPNVSDDPDVRIFLYLANDKASLYLDMSGEPLHKRGYRRDTGEAPLRETLAAALLRMAGWDRKTRLIDPMCGSGTIAIEAALWAANIAPGLGRERFGFERWASFGAEEAQALRDLKGELRSARAGQTPRIIAADMDAAVLVKAQINARAAGVKLAFREQSVFDLQVDDQPALIVTNPPYGVRLEADQLFARKVMATFCRLHGWRVALLAGSPAYAQEMSPRPCQRMELLNGDLPCEFLLYDIP